MPMLKTAFAIEPLGVLGKELGEAETCAVDWAEGAENEGRLVLGDAAETRGGVEEEEKNAGPETREGTEEKEGKESLEGGGAGRVAGLLGGGCAGPAR